MLSNHTFSSLELLYMLTYKVIFQILFYLFHFMNKMEIISNREKLENINYFHTLPIYLSNDILVKSKSYDLIKENKELIVDEKLIEFVDIFNTLRELTPQNYVYLIGSAILYRLYNVAMELLDTLSNLPEKDSNEVCKKLYPLVSRSKDFDFISYFVERYPQFKFHTVRLLAYLGEYQLMTNLAVKYKYRKKIYTSWLIRGASKNNDIEYIGEFLKRESIDDTYLKILLEEAIRAGHVDLLRKYDTNTVKSSKLLLNAALSRAKEESVMEIIKYIVCRGEEITQGMMTTFINFSRGTNGISYLLALREYDIEEIMMNIMLPRNIDKAVYLFTLVKDKERMKNRMMENADNREFVEELFNRI